MAKQPMKKPVAKKTAVKPKASATSKPTVRGGPGATGKNVSKGARNPGSMDRLFNAHKKAVAGAKAQYKEVNRMYQSDPLGRLLTGNLNKYKKDFNEVEKLIKSLKSNDKSFAKAGYKSQFFDTKKKK